MVKEIWKYISYIGVQGLEHDVNLKKKLIFFNRSMVIGFFGTLFQCINVWPFLGYKSLSFLFVCLAIIITLILNSKGKMQLSKTVLFYTVYALGYTTIFNIGGDPLFHLGGFTAFTFGLLILDYKKDKVLLIVSCFYILTCAYLGEHDYLFDAPDFSTYDGIETIRFFNIASMILLNSIFVMFMLKLNKSNEDSLKLTVEEKSKLLIQLQKNSEILEEEVVKRTTEIEKQKEVLQSKNAEKEVLLKEIHHRVKNNLQIIVSLINLQRQNLKSEEGIAVLAEIKSRIESMSIVHERMYQTANFLNIDIEIYIQQLVTNLRELYANDKVEIKIVIEDNLRLNIEESIPVGLILNELISNFYKYGYNTNGSKSECTVTARLVDNNRMFFEIRDNGPGFPEAFNVSENETLGLSLVESLIDQLEGSLNFYNDNGAVCQFQFRL